MFYNYNSLHFSRAKLLLRKKRYQEQLLQNTDAQLEHLDRMVHDIEFAQIEMQVLQGLKNGNTALKKMNDLFSIEEIEQIMDETQEGVEKQQVRNRYKSVYCRCFIGFVCRKLMPC